MNNNQTQRKTIKKLLKALGDKSFSKDKILVPKVKETKSVDD